MYQLNKIVSGMMGIAALSLLATNAYAADAKVSASDKKRLCSQIMLLDRFTDRHSQPLLGFRSIAFFTV